MKKGGYTVRSTVSLNVNERRRVYNYRRHLLILYDRRNTNSKRSHDGGLARRDARARARVHARPFIHAFRQVICIDKSDETYYSLIAHCHGRPDNSIGDPAYVTFACEIPRFRD